MHCPSMHIYPAPAVWGPSMIHPLFGFLLNGLVLGQVRGMSSWTKSIAAYLGPILGCHADSEGFSLVPIRHQGIPCASWPVGRVNDLRAFGRIWASF